MGSLTPSLPRVPRAIAHKIPAEVGRLLFFSDFENDVDTDLLTVTGGTWSVHDGVLDGDYGPWAEAIVNLVTMEDAELKSLVLFLTDRIGFHGGFAFRWVDADNFYDAYLSREYDKVGLDEYTAGAHAMLIEATLPVAYDTWYTLEASAVDTGLQAQGDGVSVSTTDPTLSSGQFGLYVRNARCYFDDFVVRKR